MKDKNVLCGLLEKIAGVAQADVKLVNSYGMSTEDELKKQPWMIKRESYQKVAGAYYEIKCRMNLCISDELVDYFCHTQVAE